MNNFNKNTKENFENLDQLPETMTVHADNTDTTACNSDAGEAQAAAIVDNAERAGREEWEE